MNTPDAPLSLAGGKPNFGNLAFHAGRALGRPFAYGAFGALSFLISCVVAYYVLVLPVTKLIQLVERNRAATQRDCPECTMSIPAAARRCPECTAEIVPVTEQPRQVVSSRAR